MRKLLASFSLVLTACGGSVAVVPTTEAPAPESAATAAPGDPATDAGGRVRPEGPDAPDFVLTLGEGGTFQLSAEAKPVYMVFWAEW